MVKNNIVRAQLLRMNCKSYVYQRAVLLVFLCFITCLKTYAQRTDNASADRANKFFILAKNYEAALPLYQQAIDEGVSDPIVHYRLGVCYTYASSLSEQYKAIPYLERALQQKSQADIPEEVHLLLRPDVPQKHQDQRGDIAVGNV